MQCPNCQTINPAKAKFCLECGNRLVVCPHCGTVNLPVAKFCIECGTALSATVQANGTASAAPVPQTNSSFGFTATTPKPVVQQLLPPEERRVVTIMFADITGSTPLADRMDPEDLRAILTGYFNLMTEQIHKHDGTVEKYIGDAVMAVFGSPIAHEDDPDRAIRAALDMQEALNKFNERRIEQDPQAIHLQMRIGINTGEVAIPSNITHQRQDFLITGDAVNIAARLQQAAAPDTILVGERTYLTTREVFAFRPIAPLHLKGKPEPVAARVVLGLRKSTPAITQHPRGIEGHRVPLVGRSLELTLMHANYARVKAERQPHLITILGAPGVGKSRLVRDFVEREQDKLRSASSATSPASLKVLQGRCPPYGEGITYWPLIEILRSLLNVHEREENKTLQERFISFVDATLKKAQRTEPTEEIASTIIRSIGRDLDTKGVTSEREKPRRETQIGTVVKQVGTQVALLRAWRIFLEALATTQPLIIIVDDLQWADEALLDLLEYLTDRITNVPILFLCPARSDFFERRREWGGGRRNFTTIELEALPTEESNELIDALLNNCDLPDILRYTILTRSEGNPFFVEEIIRMLIDQGVLTSKEIQDENGRHWCYQLHSDLPLNEWSSSIEHPEDTLINRHYILPLPRVPDTIQGVLAARIDLLNPVEKLILQHAALIGRTFWLSSLQELAYELSKDALLEAVDSLIAHDFISEAEKQVRSPVPRDQFFTFKHILTRDVVYNNIPRARRSQMHAHLALWLEEKTTNDRITYVELLAYHYQQALSTWSSNLTLNTIEVRNFLNPDEPPMRITRSELRKRAITYLVMAGDQALHSYYTIRALQAYNDAFEIMSENADPLEKIKMHERLGDAHWQRGNRHEAWQEFRRALALTTTEDTQETVEKGMLLCLYDRLGELTTRWFYDHELVSHVQEIQSYIDAGLRLTEDQPLSSKRVSFLTYQAFWYNRQVEMSSGATRIELLEQALTSGYEALRIAEQLDNPYVLSLTFDAISFTYGHYRKYQEAHRINHRRQQLESQLTARAELYDLYMSMGQIHLSVADYPTALMWLGRAWNNAQTMESPSIVVESMVLRMHAWRQWNRWDEAVSIAHEILQIIEHYQSHPKYHLWTLETLATIAYRRGEQEEGDQYTRQYKRLLDQLVDSLDNQSGAIFKSKMHSIHYVRRNWEQAVQDYQEKLHSSEPLPMPEVVATLAELEVLVEKSVEEQAGICERAVALGEASGARKSLMIALRAQGHMYLKQEQWNLAEDNLRRALQLCEVLDLPWERGNTLHLLGTMYRHRADADNRQSRRSADLGRARYHFEQAIGFFESLGARPAIERAKQELAQVSALHA
jgi:class 3 adenylate cyclase/tetratricopeptide (TPR) repeat protein